MTLHLSAASFHIIALSWTLLIEAIGIALWARLAYPHCRRALWRALGCSLAINLLVHTLFWYSQPFFFTYGIAGLYSAELLVVALEALLYARLLPLPGITPWLLSLLLNLASFLSGLWLWQILLLPSS
ncbi:MAG: hypothetical protein IT328_22845 [Caldilineaceae bacterium]|nr:hypothetical protein [Caldilineaceae bacterium]